MAFSLGWPESVDADGAKLLWVVNKVAQSSDDQFWVGLDIPQLSKPASNEFTVGDIGDPTQLVDRLKRAGTNRESKDTVAQFLWRRFAELDPGLTNELFRFGGTMLNTNSMRTNLVKGLNRILEEPRLDHHPDFSTVPLSSETLTVRGGQVSGSSLRMLNRMVLADALLRDYWLARGNWIRTERNSEVGIDLATKDRFTSVRLAPKSKARLGPLELDGQAAIWSRNEKSQPQQIATPFVLLGVRCTEFTVTVLTNGETFIQVDEGEVLAINRHATNNFLQLTQRTAARYDPNQKKLHALPYLEVATNKMAQTFLYYPGVLHLDELQMSEALERSLTNSLAAYRKGNLVAALEQYSQERGDTTEPTNNVERLYLAALSLVVGQAQHATALLDALSPSETDGYAAQRQLAEALRQLMAGTQKQVFVRTNEPRTATGWLAESYYQQSRAGESDVPRDWERRVYKNCHSALEQALVAARRATATATNFSFAWVRQAELEFGFARRAEASASLEHAMEHQEGNAQAVALKGFLAWARRDYAEASQQFHQAAELEPRLGNAWIGRGLTDYHGQNVLDAFRYSFAGGRWRSHPESPALEDLERAAASEPKRSLAKSYLAKAYYESAGIWGKETKQLETNAAVQLKLAKELDPQDPTPWLYSALLLRDQNRFNEAIEELEESQLRSDNRQIYRSQLLLDEDAAVRGANLAALYRDAGLLDVGLREAVRAVNTDYANDSAHLFLANTYNELRDPRQYNLRYETPWLSEYLVANLLSPVGASTLSPQVSQQEYSQLFDRNRLGLSSASEYGSGGDWLQSVVQHGTFNRFSYAVEAAYRSENGYRQNNEVEQLATTLRMKQQLTPSDVLYLQGTYYDGKGGDVRPLYRESDRIPGLHTQERLEPLLLAGLHHRWNPEMHSLFLVGWVEDTFQVHNPSNGTFYVDYAGIDSVVPGIVRQDYRTESSLYTVELQQLFQYRPHSVVLGARYQGGEFDTVNQHMISGSSFPTDTYPIPPSFFSNTTQHIQPRLERRTAYGYYYWQALESLTLIGGLSYDWLRYPENFRSAPVVEGERTTDQFSPKAGFLWALEPSTTLRGAYCRTLGGVAFDQSFQLEPSQVAGIIQSYRSVIPEAVAGANAAARSDVAGLALDQKLGHGTYVGIGVDWLKSEVSRLAGTYDIFYNTDQAAPTGTPERLDYIERAFTFALHQRIHEEWSVGLGYRHALAEFEDVFPQLALTMPPQSSSFHAQRHESATLDQLTFQAVFNHGSGWFAEGQALWTEQSNHDYNPPLAGDVFWQFNLFAGYRFRRRCVEVRVGVLNLTDQNYHLNPLNLITQLPHERTFYASLRFNL